MVYSALTTLLAFAIHAGLVAGYIRFFDKTSSVLFRIIHGAEIFAVVFAVFLLAHELSGKNPSLLISIAISLGTLMAIDLVIFTLFPGLQRQFDAGHFITAYLMVGLAIYLANRLSSQ